jgi:site-specific recombinase XerD
MEDDMVARGFADRTRESYLWAVTGLARFYRRPPDGISDEEVQAYLVHLLRDRQRSWSTCNVVANGLRFFFHTTLKRDRTTFTIPAPRQRQKLPAILSREEVERVIAHTTNPKHRAMLLTTYAAGLRSVRPSPKSGGSRRGEPTCCPFRTSTSSSRCRTTLTRSRRAIRA